MVQTVNLGENEHAVTMLRGFKQMKNEQDLCDFIIKVEGVEYQAHKNILWVGSPYFKAMLKHDTKESQGGKVEMKDVDPECLKSCIDFLYSGSFDIPDEKIGQLLHVAIMLQLDKVTKAISVILKESMSAENFYEIRHIAKMYNLKTVSKSCKAYFRKNFMAISSQPGFQDVNKSDLVNIFESKHLKLTEEEKLTVSLRWVGETPEKRENLFELTKLVNLNDVSSEYLSDILENDPVIGNDFRIYKLINASYIKKTKSDVERDSYKNRIVVFDYWADCLRLFDPATDVVTNFGNEKFIDLLDFSTVCMDSYIYVLCGNKTVHRLNFRDDNPKWETMQNMIADHGASPPVASLSGSLFVIGSDTKATKNVGKFDPAANQWLRLSDKPEAILCPTLVSLNESIFCIGGWDESPEKGKAVNSFYRFTPSSSEWVDLEPMKNARTSCGAVAVEQKIFVMGGSLECREVECYDVTSKQWTSLPPMIYPHCVGAAHHIDGRIFIVEWSQYSDMVEKYDIANNKWCEVEFKNVFEKILMYGSVSIRI